MNNPHTRSEKESSCIEKITLVYWEGFFGEAIDDLSQKRKHRTLIHQNNIGINQRAAASERDKEEEKISAELSLFVRFLFFIFSFDRMHGDKPKKQRELILH